MKKETVEIHYFLIDDIKELEQNVQLLIDETIRFAQNAYAPYSKFKVSAGALLDNGETVMGANVENASYPISTCAERNLLNHIITNHSSTKIKALAIYVDKVLEKPVPPCGMCRQSLLETELNQGQNIPVYLIGKNGQIIFMERCADLLPLAFDQNFL